MVTHVLKQARLYLSFVKIFQKAARDSRKKEIEHPSNKRDILIVYILLKLSEQTKLNYLSESE